MTGATAIDQAELDLLNVYNTGLRIIAIEDSKNECDLKKKNCKQIILINLLIFQQIMLHTSVTSDIILGDPDRNKSKSHLQELTIKWARQGHPW